MDREDQEWNSLSERERSDISLNFALQKLERGTEHRHYPTLLRGFFDDFPSKVKVLADRAFEKEVLRDTRQKTHQRLLKHFAHDSKQIIERKDAFVIRASQNNLGKVLLRRSYAASNDGRRYLHHLLAEEFGHMATKVRKIESTENIPRESQKLLTLSQTVSSIRSVPGFEDFEPNSLEILGFRSTLLDSQMKTLLSLPETQIYEEARAQLISHHLIAHSMMAEKGGTLEDHLNEIINSAKIIGDRKVPALLRLGEKLGWEDLPVVLVNTDIDEFVNFGSKQIGRISFKRKMNTYQRHEAEDSLGL